LENIVCVRGTCSVHEWALARNNPNIPPAQFGRHLYFPRPCQPSPSPTSLHQEILCGRGRKKKKKTRERASGKDGGFLNSKFTVLPALESQLDAADWLDLASSRWRASPFRLRCGRWDALRYIPQRQGQSGYLSNQLFFFGTFYLRQDILQASRGI
jgi:hypothetical protein